MAPFTPMMQQYIKTKEQYQDCILFYRLGDFYEMFFEDAKIASKELEIALTGKDCGQEERAPMCGIPYHAADSYLNKLVSRGYKVAICEQMEDPRKAKGLVKREVIRVVTPGTNLNAQALDETKNNFLMCVTCTGSGKNRFGLSCVDISTGDYYVTEVDTVRKLMDEIIRFAPSELIYNSGFEPVWEEVKSSFERLQILAGQLQDSYFEADTCRQRLMRHFEIRALAGLGLADYPVGTIAAGALLGYLYETQKNSLMQLTHITPYQVGRYMRIDSTTRRNLELLETLREKQKKGSLLGVLDRTRTAMGARLLRTWIEQPLIDPQAIESRLDAIEEINTSLITRDEIREYLTPVYDLERLISRIASKTANPRDLIAFRSSLENIGPIRQLMEGYHADALCGILEDLDELQDICQLIQNAIDEDAPVSIRDGGIIKDGYDEHVDRFRRAGKDGKEWLARLETEEREKTGIKNLKVKYNKVFGYYLEVTNSYKSMVPKDWTRRQTLANAERYVTPRLKELEETILGAEDKLYALEYDLFCEIRDQTAAQMLRVQKTAKALARLDVLTSLAYVSDRNQYVRPRINTQGRIQIQGGRHPVVERMFTQEMFIENDTCLDNQENRIAIITGPNMAGKSTYMRQSALIVLMAHMGCFVPAKAADIGITDRIFTRVGASDDLASGQSTFMVEMTEVASILRNATKDSLLILDEIGRGTSTFDGLSIAWAVLEYISDPALLGAKTLFATHYHELTELEGKLPGVHNYRIAVREQGEDIIFLRKIMRGGTDKSYGIQVAKLAGVPQLVIDRAKELAAELSRTDISDRVRKAAPAAKDLTGGMAPAVEELTKDSASVTKDLTKEAAPENLSIEREAADRNGTAGETASKNQRTSKEAQSASQRTGAVYASVASRILDADLSQMRPVQALLMLDELQQELQQEHQK